MPSLLLAESAFWMPSLGELTAVGPLWTLAGTIVAILVAALVVGRNPAVSAIITMLGATVTAFVCFALAGRTAAGAFAGFAPLGGAPMLVMDNFSILFILLICLFLASVVGLWMIGATSSGREIASHTHDAPEFFTLLVGSAFGMSLMVCTTNLLMIILAIEMASLPSYAIVGFQKRNRIGAEASIKYVLFGAVTSAIMAYGVSLLYGYYGTLDLVAIGQMISGKAIGAGHTTGTNLLMTIGFFGLLAGIGFKVSAVPFHFWCPDVFEGASIEVTTWLSVASKAAGLGLVLRVVTALVSPLEDTSVLLPMSTAVGLFAAVTCTYGNLAAFPQTNVKRLLAYSSIAHAGYMLMAAAILWQPSPGGDSTHPAFSALAAYVIVYLFMNLGAFGCTALVFWATGQTTLDAFRGLGRRAPLVALAMAACLFSLIGLPPFGGFIAKFYLLLALFRSDLVWLVIIAAVNSLISLYYYARILYAMYFDDDGQPVIAVPAFGRSLVLASAVVLLLTGLPLAGLLKTRADQFARNLYPLTARSSLAPPSRHADRADATHVADSH